MIIADLTDIESETYLDNEYEDESLNSQSKGNENDNGNKKG